MRVPGGNLLGKALQLIGKTPVTLYAASGRVKQPNGVFLESYLPGVLYPRGSLQPVDRSRYQMYGLDLSKTYYTWYVPNVDVENVQRNSGGSVFEAMGKRFQMVGGEDWLAIDGWQGFLGVLIGPATGALTNA